MSYVDLYKELATCMAFFGLEQCYLRPHSFRRGGATWTWAQTGNLDFVTQKGRWGSQKTALLYLADASCEQVLQALSHQQRLRVAEFGRFFACQFGARGKKRARN
eukprot:5795515-Amphidinium_carterae.1